MEFSVGLTASGQCFKLNLSLIIFFRKSRREGVFCPGNPERRGGLVLQEIQMRGGVKKRPHPSGGGWIFSGITH